MLAEADVLPPTATSSRAPPAASQAVEGGSSSPPHVFPVLAASLLFLKKIEIALETSVFERLVGEVTPFNCNSTVVPVVMQDTGTARGVCRHQLVPGCNQHAKRENSRAAVRLPVAAAAAGSHAGAASERCVCVSRM